MQNRIFRTVVLSFAMLSMAPALHAQEIAEETNMIEELDPFAFDIEDQLNLLDQQYERETGESAHIESHPSLLWPTATGCQRWGCTVYAKVVRSEQKLYLYVNGNQVDSWPVSTGVRGRGTPNFDKHPNGRIYNAYTSSAYPGGDYKGLGNMPYAVFIQGGFAIHGTPSGNWSKLGTRASHGCIRSHPDKGLIFNKLVRQYGISNVWITVEETFTSDRDGRLASIAL